MTFIFFCRYDFKGIIDYIFYSKLNMTPLGILGPLSADWFRDNNVVGCPHPHIPSGKYQHLFLKVNNKGVRFLFENFLNNFKIYT